MKKRSRQMLAGIYILVLVLFLSMVQLGNRAVTVIAEALPVTNRTCVVIDAGHGGEDGGATSCTGVLESHINLEIAKRLEDLLHLLGIDTQMIRTTDRSVYTEGQTISAKKVSDLKQRVHLVNTAHNPVLISIHQNYYTDGRYYGPQVFYGRSDESRILAERMQTSLVNALQPKSNRKSKPADNIYLMEKINCPGVLVECGFLSNPQEEAMLREEAYQKKLCCILATVTAEFIALDHRTNE